MGKALCPFRSCSAKESSNFDGQSPIRGWWRNSALGSSSYLFCTHRTFWNNVGFSSKAFILITWLVLTLVFALWFLWSCLLSELGAVPRKTDKCWTTFSTSSSEGKDSTRCESTAFWKMRWIRLCRHFSKWSVSGWHSCKLVSRYFVWKLLFLWIKFWFVCRWRWGEAFFMKDVIEYVTRKVNYSGIVAVFQVAAIMASMAKSQGTKSHLKDESISTQWIAPMPIPTKSPEGPSKLSTYPGSGSLYVPITTKEIIAFGGNGLWF